MNSAADKDVNEKHVNAAVTNSVWLGKNDAAR